LVRNLNDAVAHQGPISGCRREQAGLSLAQIRAALIEAVPDGQVPGPQEWEHLAAHLRRELASRITELDRLLGALSG
jgi:DNA-binding transcriptional MerR regulator